MSDKNNQLPSQGEWTVKKERKMPSMGEDIKITSDDGGVIAKMGGGEYHQVHRNANGICTAINNTYGKGIDPEQISDLLQAFKDVRSGLIDSGHYKENSIFINAIDRQIKKAEL